jgi:predicted RNase H-like HicB family nuclease
MLSGMAGHTPWRYIRERRRIRDGARPRYRVEVEADGDAWLVRVPELPNVFTQALTLDDVEPMARSVTALMLEVPDDSFDLEIPASAHG